MSYFVNVANDSKYLDFETSNGQRIGPGATWRSEQLGNAWISSRQFGTVAFLDLAMEKPAGSSDETWGVLISYQGEEIVGRYEGGGQLHVEIGPFLQATLSGMALRRIFLTAMEIAQGSEAADAPVAAEGAADAG